MYADSAQHVAERINESHLISPTLLNNQANMLVGQKRFKEAILIQEKACKLADSSTLEYLELLQNLSLLYLFSGEHKEALKIEKTAIELFDNRIRHNLQSISAYNLSNYWNTLYHWYCNFIPKCAINTREQCCFII